MSKIEEAKEKLFENLSILSGLKYDSIFENFKDLKFHKGDDEIYFINSKGLRDGLYDCMDRFDYEFPETADDFFKINYNRGEVLFTADITIFHKDYVKYIIEIVDETYIDSEKINRIVEFSEMTYYYQVVADDILSWKESDKEAINLFELKSGM